MEYRDFNDYELLSYIGEATEEAVEILYKKYEPLITSIAKRMYKQIEKRSGLELSDLIQEGMVGLSFAIHTFDDKNGTMFYTYARTCIERKIISAIVSTQRLKHRPLNEAISYNIESTGRELVDFDVLLSDNTLNPEVMLISSEAEIELQNDIYHYLGDQERQILELKISGFTYPEIAELLDISKKKVDNTMQRIRAKLKKIRDK